MGWLDYYNLLIKYDGDMTQATHAEIVNVIIKNNYNPDEAMKQAREAYAKQRGELSASI